MASRTLSSWTDIPASAPSIKLRYAGKATTVIVARDSTRCPESWLFIRQCEDDQEDRQYEARGHRAPLRTFLLRALSFAAVSALILNNTIAPVFASDYRAAPALTEASAAGQLNAKFLPLGIGKSVVVDLPRDVKRRCWLQIPRSRMQSYAPRSAHISSALPLVKRISSSSTLAGQQIAAYDIAVTRDLNGVRAALRAVSSLRRYQIEGVGDGVMLTGTASNPAEAQQAQELAARLVGDSDKVFNNISVRARDQVTAESDCRGDAAQHHQTTRRRSQCTTELRHGGSELQQRRPIHCTRTPSHGRQLCSRQFWEDDNLHGRRRSVSHSDTTRHGERWRRYAPLRNRI